MFGSDKAIFRFTGPFGIPVEIGGTLLLLVLIFVSFTNLNSLPYDLLFVGMLIGSIFAHEMGHAWGCRVQGIAVKRIMLHGGGGFCEHARARTRAQQEFIVAMGPIVNLGIWAIASLIAPMFSYGTAAWALYWLGLMNLFLALFNLLPVHPLDGGKLFYLALQRWMPRTAATQISGLIGLILALMWIPGMILLYLNLGLILFFFPPLRLHWRMLRTPA